MTTVTPIGSWERRPVTQDRPAAVYYIYDTAGALLYIGSGYDPGKRVQNHRLNMPWGGLAAEWSATWYQSRNVAMSAERSEIIRLVPPYNIHGTDLHRQVSLGTRPPSRMGLAAYDRDRPEGDRLGECWLDRVSGLTGRESEAFLSRRAKQIVDGQTISGRYLKTAEPPDATPTD